MKHFSDRAPLSNLLQYAVSLNMMYTRARHTSNSIEGLPTSNTYSAPFFPMSEKLRLGIQPWWVRRLYA